MSHQFDQKYVGVQQFGKPQTPKTLKQMLAFSQQQKKKLIQKVQRVKQAADQSKKLKALKDPMRAWGLPQIGGAKRAPTAYNKFVGNLMKGGKHTMKQAAGMWKQQKRAQ